MAIEAALLVPAVMVFLAVAVAVGRVETLSGTVDESARTAARTLSLDRSWTTVEEAKVVATKAVNEVLAQQGVSCPATTVDVHLGTLPGTAAGTLDTVAVDVSCTTTVLDLLPAKWVPASVTLTGHFSSVKDHYRSQ